MANVDPISHVRREVESIRFCRECNWPADQQDNVEQRASCYKPCEACRRGFDPEDDLFAWSPKVVDCDIWADCPEFWLQQLVVDCFSDELYEALLDLFEVSEEQHRSFVESHGLDSIRSWPLIKIDCGQGYTLEYLHSNFPEDFDCRAYLDHPEWPSAVFVGSAGGNFQLPAFRWPEVQAIARSVKTNGHGPFARHAILVLWPLFYVTTDDDDRVIQPQFSDALLSVARNSAAIPRVIQERNVKVPSLRWQYKTDYGWSCPDSNSRRTGHHGSGLSESEIRRLNEFLAAVGDRRG